MHNSASVLENKTHKLLWYFDIQTDHIISTKRPDFIFDKKKKEKTCRIVDFVVSADHRVKLKESEKKNMYLELKKLWNMNAMIIVFTNPSARAGYDTWSIFKRSLTGLNSEFSFS